METIQKDIDVKCLNEDVLLDRNEKDHSSDQSSAILFLAHKYVEQKSKILL